MQERKTCVHKRKYIESARAGGAKKQAQVAANGFRIRVQARKGEKKMVFGSYVIICLCYIGCVSLKGEKKTVARAKAKMRHLRKQLFFFSTFFPRETAARVLLCVGGTPFGA